MTKRSFWVTTFSLLSGLTIVTFAEEKQPVKDLKEGDQITAIRLTISSKTSEFCFSRDANGKWTAGFLKEEASEIGVNLEKTNEIFALINRAFPNTLKGRRFKIDLLNEEFLLEFQRNKENCTYYFTHKENDNTATEDMKKAMLRISGLVKW